MIGLWHKNPTDTRAGNENEAGQALVELAVTVPVLLMVLMGAMEFARFVYLAIEVSNSARAAAQYAAMNGGASADFAGITAAARADSFNLSSPQVTATVLSDSCACSGAETTVVACNTDCASGQRIFETVTVQTSARYAPMFRIPSFSSGTSSFGSNITLKGYAQQMVLPE
jgi:Flp pilus assembly protein TadG